MEDDKITKVLLLTGKTAVKKIGLHDQIVKALETAKIEFILCDEVRANPEVKLVAKCIDICRDNAIQAVLAIGGGSAVDSAKAIIVGAKFAKETPAMEIWDYYVGTKTATSAVPLYVVLTISATGTEHNSGGVVQNDELK